MVKQAILKHAENQGVNDDYLQFIQKHKKRPNLNDEMKPLQLAIPKINVPLNMQFRCMSLR